MRTQAGSLKNVHYTAEAARAPQDSGNVRGVSEKMSLLALVMIHSDAKRGLDFSSSLTGLGPLSG